MPRPNLKDNINGGILFLFNLSPKKMRGKGKK
jgi:hypothetical protein